MHATPSLPWPGREQDQHGRHDCSPPGLKSALEPETRFNSDVDYPCDMFHTSLHEISSTWPRWQILSSLSRSGGWVLCVWCLAVLTPVLVCVSLLSPLSGSAASWKTMQAVNWHINISHIWSGSVGHQRPLQKLLELISTIIYKRPCQASPKG